MYSVIHETIVGQEKFLELFSELTLEWRALR